MKNFKFSFYGITWVINFLLIVAVFAAFDANSFQIYFNSDTLYLGSIYKDLFIDGTGFEGWYLNAAPNFFPDMFIYFFINTLFKDFRTAYLVFSFVQYFLILILLNLLVKTVNPKIKFEYLSFLNLIFPVFLMVELISHNFLHTYFIFSHSFHTGMFINVLISLILFFKHLNTEKNSHLFFVALITFIGTYNDRLFLVMFTIPVGIVFILNFFYLKSKMLKKAGFVIISVSIAALVLFKFTRINPIFHCIGLDQKYMNFDNVIYSLNKLFTQHYNYIRDLRLQGFISIIMILNIVVLPVLAVKIFLQIKSGSGSLFKQNEIVFFTLIFFSIIITFFSPALNGYYLGEGHLRYNIFSLYFSVFNIVFFIYLLFKNRVKSVNFISVFLLLFFTVFVVRDYTEKDVCKKIREVTQFYPEKVKRVDEFAEKYHLKYGLATYWNAKYTTMFSQANLRVYTIIDENLNIWLHVMNKNWYFNYDKGKYNKPVFNFIITDKLDTKKIQTNFGIAEDSLQYNNKTYILKLKNGIKYNPADKKPYLIK